ncbi:MAG TPA: hypothetical protein VF796_19135 [Humisphaera sp.]
MLVAFRDRYPDLRDAIVDLVRAGNDGGVLAAADEAATTPSELASALILRRLEVMDAGGWCDLVLYHQAGGDALEHGLNVVVKDWTVIEVRHE